MLGSRSRSTARAVAAPCWAIKGARRQEPFWSFLFEPEEGWREERRRWGARSAAAAGLPGGNRPLRRLHRRGGTVPTSSGPCAARLPSAGAVLRLPAGGARLAPGRAADFTGGRGCARRLRDLGSHRRSLAARRGAVRVGRTISSRRRTRSRDGLPLFRSPGAAARGAFHPTSPSPEEGSAPARGRRRCGGRRRAEPVARGGVYLRSARRESGPTTAFRRLPGPPRETDSGPRSRCAGGARDRRAGTPPGEHSLLSPRRAGLDRFDSGAVYVVRRQGGCGARLSGFRRPLSPPRTGWAPPWRSATCVLAAGAAGARGARARCFCTGSPLRGSLEQELVARLRESSAASVAVLGDRLSVGSPGDTGSQSPAAPSSRPLRTPGRRGAAPRCAPYARRPATCSAPRSP